MQKAVVFLEGSADEDWRMAEQEVDQRLAKVSSLVEKGHKALSSAAGGMIEHELDDIRHIVAGWMSDKGGNDKHKEYVQDKKITVNQQVKAEHAKSPNKTAKTPKKEAPKKAVTKLKITGDKKAAAKRGGKKA